MIIQIIASYGLCCILMYSSLFDKERNYLSKVPTCKEFLTCPLCLGFWTGILVDTTANWNSSLEDYAIIRNRFIFALASSGFCFFIECLRKRIDNY